MPQPGRNEPCPCGSGKKYKQCHAPIEAEQQNALRKLKQAPDTLLPKIMEALDRFGMELPNALQLFWNGAYTVNDIKELDEHEDRGSERFLTWFTFDARNADGATPLQRLAADPEGLELTDAERQVLAGWQNVHFQPYTVVSVRKGQTMQVRPLFGTETIELEDRAAAKRIEAGEVLIAHLIPAGGTYYVAGAAAQLTADTLDKLHEFAAIHLEDLRRVNPDATFHDLIETRSYIFNHLIMALPREEHELTKWDEMMAMARAGLNVTAEQFGFGGEDDERSLPVMYADTDADAEADAEEAESLADAA